MLTHRTVLILALSALAFGCGNSRPSTPAAASTVASSTSASTTTIATSTSTVVTTPPVVPPVPAQFEAVAFEVLDEGTNSLRGSAQGAHEVHVATDPDWTLFWPTHSARTRPPVVDFSQESVVATFMGQISGGSHFTQVVNVSRDVNSDDLQALVREFRLGAWKPNIRILTTPFQIVRCATAVSGQGTLTIERQTQLDFETLTFGSVSEIGRNDPTYKGGLHVFRDAAAFNAFHVQVAPNQRPPAVDFQRQMVVAVMGPYIPRFGNTVETLRLVHDPKTHEIRVISRVNPYRGGAAPPRAIQTPYQFLRVTIATGTIRAERATPLLQSRPQTGLGRGTTTVVRASLVVRDAAALADLWRARIGGGTPPQVDFSKDQVVISFVPSGSDRSVTIARCTLLEDDELAVTLNTTLSSPTRDPRYVFVTTPRTLGPVAFESIDVTPRP
ncbi:MAG: hypothetical protein JKY65_01120 [Planctomycetes bacterium]|nr:hypothetical protein [Planctomycetota bacterium]